MGKVKAVKLHNLIWDYSKNINIKLRKSLTADKRRLSTFGAGVAYEYWF
jgi:hypothetical protein